MRLQEDPDDRYPTVLEFAVALDRAFSTRRPRSRWSRRRPIADGGAIFAVMALALVAAAAGLWAVAAGLRPVAPAPAPVPAPVRFGPGHAAPPLRLINVLGMTLVLVPAGEFLMGSSDSDPTAKDIEKPRHRVRISRPFYLGAHEVTVGQFRAFVSATGYRTEAEASGEGGTVYNSAEKRFEPIPECNWRNPGLPLPQSDDEPVVQVSENDAAAFCRWLSDQDHRFYRLPTEAEWEYACRARTTTRWCMGDDPAQLDQFAWVRDQVGCSTHPVGRKKPNAFGLYDMHGNVWEWCLDRFRPYPDAPEVDPAGASAGAMGVLRGGACARAEVERTRSAARLRRKPSYRFNKYGFRVCCPLAATAVGP